ncbi:MAG: hypothetical protein RLZZ292_3878 [Bacteroidota bacterium]
MTELQQRLEVNKRMKRARLDLRLLDLTGNETELGELKDYWWIKELDLWDNKIQDYAFLQSLINLQFLDLRYNLIVDISFLQPKNQATNATQCL